MFVYVLELQNGKYYVGRTNYLTKRVEEHMNGRGAEWTKLHKPIRILKEYPIDNPFYEDTILKMTMHIFGIDNVRGGSYCQSNLSSSQIATLQREIRGALDQCFVCGGDHFVQDCDTRT